MFWAPKEKDAESASIIGEALGKFEEAVEVLSKGITKADEEITGYKDEIAEQKEILHEVTTRCTSDITIVSSSKERAIRVRDKISELLA